MRGDKVRGMLVHRHRQVSKCTQSLADARPFEVWIKNVASEGLAVVGCSIGAVRDDAGVGLLEGRAHAGQSRGGRLGERRFGRRGNCGRIRIAGGVVAASAIDTEHAHCADERKRCCQDEGFGANRGPHGCRLAATGAPRQRQGPGGTVVRLREFSRDAAVAQ